MTPSDTPADPAVAARPPPFMPCAKQNIMSAPGVRFSASATGTKARNSTGSIMRPP
jgi:hypothetical protein